MVECFLDPKVCLSNAYVRIFLWHKNHTFMKTRITFFVLTLFFLLFIFTPNTFADDSQNIKLGTIVQTSVNIDYRPIALYNYLESQNSPLAPYATLMVQDADKYAIPWELVAAISGTESTFAKVEPANCYNSWGWGIYGNQTMCFNSYSDAINTISKSLRENYINKWGCRYISDIGKIYASSPTWSQHTTYFMNQIDNYYQSQKIHSLPISM